MLKKIISVLIVVVMLAAFSSCSGNDKNIMTTEDGNEYMVVRDSDGNIVINENNKLQVYPLNENGKKQKSDAGEYIKEYIDFNGQVVLGNSVETAELKFELPDSFVDHIEIPGYFYSEVYNSDVYFTYYNENIENKIAAAEQNCENLLESYGSEVFTYEKYSVTINDEECVAIKIACTSSEYYKNAYQYYIPYDTGFYIVDCVISTDNAKKVNFDKFAKDIELK